MKALALTGLLLLLSACSWLPPAPEMRPRLAQADVPELLPAAPDWPTAQWWHKYQDPSLDQLLNSAVMGAPSLAQAESRFADARESVRVAAAAAGLHVDAQASFTRQRLSDNGLFPPQFLGFNWYNQADLGIHASYSFDWWHKQQAATQAAVDEARAAQAERSAAVLSVTTAIADSYFGWQADQAQLALLHAQLQLVQQRQQIAAQRIAASLDAAQSRYELESELAALHAGMIQVEGSAQLRRLVIAKLLGANLDDLPAFAARPLPSVNPQLPDTVRIDLLARRPDIVASRWRIAAAEQRLRGARAEFLPDFSINSLAGLSSIELGKLLNTGSAVPAIGAALHLPLFNGGLLQAQYGVRAAQLQSAIASYNATIFTAANEVATQALNLRQLAAQQAQRQLQITAVQQRLAAIEARQHQGLTDGRPTLLARQALQEQLAALRSLEASTLSADIALQASLGGGYQTAEAGTP